MAGRRARLVFTDPPYNVPIDGHVGGLGRTKHADFAMAAGEMGEAGLGVPRHRTGQPRVRQHRWSSAVRLHRLAPRL